VIRPRRGLPLALVLWAGILTAATNVAAQEYRPAFHPDQLKRASRDKPNEVMVLGTPHLADLPTAFRPEMVAPLLDRLVKWRPTAIATENLSGLQCDSLRRYTFRYAETVSTYCPDPSAAGHATGLDVPAANAEVERLLASWPATPSPAQRRHMAAVFLAAGEDGSALVQWLRLASDEGRAGDGLVRW